MIIISSTSGRLARSRTRSRAQTSSDPVARQRFKDETGLEIPESQPKVNLDEFVDLEHWVATLYSVLEFFGKSRSQMLDASLASPATDC